MPHKPPQKSAGFAPVFHPVAGVVVPHRVFIGVGILSDDGQRVHVDSSTLKLLHGLLGFDMRAIDRYHRV
jgi:hypothetical protein